MEIVYYITKLLVNVSATYPTHPAIVFVLGFFDEFDPVELKLNCTLATPRHFGCGQCNGWGSAPVATYLSSFPRSRHCLLTLLAVIPPVNLFHWTLCSFGFMYLILGHANDVVAQMYRNLVRRRVRNRCYIILRAVASAHFYKCRL